jgi:hypothetical protein
VFGEVLADAGAGCPADSADASDDVTHNAGTELSTAVN